MAGWARPWGRERFIVVAKGPNPVEDKVHTAILDDAVSGHVVGAADRFIGEPGVIPNQPAPTFETAPKPVIVTVPFATPQEAREDGSVTHVVPRGRHPAEHRGGL